MNMVNIFEAKARLSELIERAATGERILICKRNQPIAELRPIPAERNTPRPVGLAKGLVDMPAAFFDPLPDDELEAFNAEAVDATHVAGPASVAETRPQKRRTPRRASARPK
ncbi:MAG: type II toxin-antitoxin system prevent-host-death family antitoxin [Vicinamibacterales bacterium]